jgi:hypothetical protein
VIGDQRLLLLRALAFYRASISYSGGIKTQGMWLPSGSVIALGVMPPVVTEDRASARMLA